MKVSEMPYVRPNKDEVIAKINELCEKFENAKDGQTAIEVLKEMEEYSTDVQTNFTLAFIHFSQDTANESYVAEQDYIDEISPEVSFASQKFNEAIFKSPFRSELEKHFNKVFFDRIKVEADVTDERLIPIQTEENKTVSEYTKMMSGILVDYNGEKLPPAGIVKYAHNQDIKLRRGAYEALGKAYMEHAEELDNFYDKLVKLRDKQGKTLGLENFCPIGYAHMQRTCYDKNDIAAFRANVKKYFVPLCVKLEERVKKELGLDKLTVADLSLYSKEEVKPHGTSEELFEAARQMYTEMSPDTKELFNKMADMEAFDLLSRPGKWGGGYMTEIPKYKISFILSNFNGSIADIDVLTHEFGHSLNGYKRMQKEFCGYKTYTSEIAECHSISMEFFAYPWMDKFMGDQTEQYKFAHIAGAMTLIPYGTIVDYFQQQVYEHPEMTPAERNKLWADLDKEFRPYVDNDGLPFYGDGRTWQRQAHIFESPFYYIDYCLAQFTAFQFLALSQKDYKSAFEKYMKFISLSIDYSFTEILDLCGLKSPFEEDSFKDIVATIEKMLNL